MGDTKAGKRGMKGTKTERTPYSYERVASPYMGQSATGGAVPMQNYGQGGSYEPMRHGGV